MFASDLGDCVCGLFEVRVLEVPFRNGEIHRAFEDAVAGDPKVSYAK